MELGVSAELDAANNVESKATCANRSVVFERHHLPDMALLWKFILAVSANQ
jgi:hypothetical protein